MSLLGFLLEIVLGKSLLCGLHGSGVLKFFFESLDFLETLLKGLGILSGVLNSLHFGDLSAEIFSDFCDFSHIDDLFEQSRLRYG